MAPKKQASKKAEQKRKEKIVEDKTFGLKNKNKSKNVQRYIQEVTKQVKGSGTREERLKEEEKKKKQKAKEAEESMKSLFAAAITQPRVPPGVDPKTIVCEFFKQAVCTKGNRCKFAHDLNVAKKAAKINLYTDNRDEEKAKDVMDTWDQSKLEEVISEKHGTKPANQTDIVCKYFLDAIEKSLYGWFWVCPNGGKECKYRHALPPGYVFKTKKERDAEKANKVEEISIEEIIEQQRAALGHGTGTPVTEESLAKWKADKLERKRLEEEKRRKEEAKKTGGRGLNALSGRALFTFDPTLFRDDDDADEDEYSVHDEDEEDEEKPSPQVDAAAAVMDKSLYLEDVGDLDSLKK
ncbi:TPA: hypothetical protein N0F65_012390 [Lagenidium giganteum]|uniref:C3H1-type domain-containing protein n=1 Tax=Lagenidium giganteum TaxID=4803 RepID=A0AAV2YMI1_9STRA|nr:TPA: hypothetical protein N0F65_012390 [Lagenidium giganteum]